MNATALLEAPASDPSALERRIERRVGRSDAPRFQLVDAIHPDRNGVEAAVRDGFADAFRARPDQFAPFLLAAREAFAPGEPTSAACLAIVGIRPAGSGPLFLERYLDAPVERAIRDLGGAVVGAVSRDDVAEIGNLVAIRRGQAMLLFVILAVALRRAGYRWLVCTATPRVRALLVRLGTTPLDLGAADPARLGPDAHRWGDYYDCGPRILAISLDAALADAPRIGCVVQALDTHATDIDTIRDRLVALRTSGPTCGRPA